MLKIPHRKKIATTNTLFWMRESFEFSALTNTGDFQGRQPQHSRVGVVAYAEVCRGEAVNLATNHRQKSTVGLTQAGKLRYFKI